MLRRSIRSVHRDDINTHCKDPVTNTGQDLDGPCWTHGAIIGTVRVGNAIGPDGTGLLRRARFPVEPMGAAPNLVRNLIRWRRDERASG